MRLSVNISKKFSDFELNAAFSVEDNETLALLGASGSGKTLTLSCIAGIAKPDSGFIELNGHKLFDSDKRVCLPPQKRHLGLLFQSYALFPNMTVEGNIRCGLNRIKSRDEMQEKLRELTASFRLTGLEKHYPQELSGGQQQRVALARLMACEPELLLLDEPFSALDEALKWDLEQELFETLSHLNVPVVYVTHDMREVQRLCGKVCVIDNGKTQAVQLPEELFNRPRTVAAARLSGYENVFEAERVDEKTIYVDGERLRISGIADNDLCGAAVKASGVRIGDGENKLKCTLVRIIEDSGKLIAVCRLEGRRTALRVEASREALEAYRFGDRITISIPGDSIIPLKAH